MLGRSVEVAVDQSELAVAADEVYELPAAAAELSEVAVARCRELC